MKVWQLHKALSFYQPTLSKWMKNWCIIFNENKWFSALLYQQLMRSCEELYVKNADVFIPKLNTMQYSFTMHYSYKIPLKTAELWYSEVSAEHGLILCHFLYNQIMYSSVINTEGMEITLIHQILSMCNQWWQQYQNAATELYLCQHETVQKVQFNTKKNLLVKYWWTQIKTFTILIFQVFVFGGDYLGKKNTITLLCHELCQI